MKIALVGLGGMGKTIASLVTDRGHEICSTIDPKNPAALHKEITKSSLNGADVAIEFTHPSVVMSNIDQLLSLKTPVVIGTTGWYDKNSEMESLVTKHHGTALWSSNFSVGVNLYFKAVEAVAKLIGRFEEYDVWGTELHHRNKADSPSGTAKTLEEIILRNVPHKSKVVEDKLDRRPEKSEFHFSSTRGGSVNFSHTIGFDSAADTITISHSARNRDGYALGAIQAAEWLHKRSPGFYQMEDFLNEVLSR